MSILETFYILFKSDSKDVKKGADEAEKSTKKLNESLKDVNTTTGRVGESFVNAGRSIAGMAAALVSVGAILGSIKESYQYTLNLDRTSQALNVNIETLDAWGRAVQRNGGTAEGFQSSIKSIAQTLNIRNKDAIKLLPMLADTFARVGKDRSMRFGQKLGLDQATIMLLQQGRREVDSVIARQKELGVVTERDAEIATKFNNSWSDMTFAFRIMWLQIADVVLPIFTKIADGFTTMAKYLQKHSTVVIGTLLALGAAALIFSAPFIAANAVVIGVTAGIVALSVAIGILVEDIIAFSKGNSSLIGDMLNKWPTVGKVLKAVFYEIKEAIKSVIEVFKFLWQGFDKVNAFLSNMENKAGKALLNFIKAKPEEEGAPPVFEFIKGKPGEKEAPSVFESIKAGMEDAENTPLMAQTSSSIFNGGNSKSNAVYTGPITINTQASNGEEVGGALARGLKDHFRQATGSFDDGILA